MEHQTGSETEPELHPKLRKLSFFFGVILSVAYVVVAALYAPRLFIVLLMGATDSPKAGDLSLVLMLGIIALAGILFSLPLFFIWNSYYKKKYRVVLILIGLVFAGLGWAASPYIEYFLLQYTNISFEQAPSNILILSKKALPQGYAELESGKKLIDNHFVQRFFLKDNHEYEISMIYTIGEACKFNTGSDWVEYVKKDCSPAGSSQTCYVQTLISGSLVKDYRGEEKRFGRFLATYEVVDGNSCARVEVKAPHERDAFSKEEILNIVNSLERTP